MELLYDKDTPYESIYGVFIKRVNFSHDSPPEFLVRYGINDKEELLGYANIRERAKECRERKKKAGISYGIIGRYNISALVNRSGLSISGWSIRKQDLVWDIEWLKKQKKCLKQVSDSPRYKDRAEKDLKKLDKRIEEKLFEVKGQFE